MPAYDEAPQQFSDPSLAAADQQEERLNPKPERKKDESVSALIRKFEAENTLPDVDRDVLKMMDGERKYVSTDANFATTPGGVSTNYLYKFQQVHKAQIAARDPQVAVRPKKRLGELPPEVTQPLDDFAETMQTLIAHYFSPDEMDIKTFLGGIVQDIDTVGIAFVKLDWLEDMQRDPVGAWRPNDFQDTIARMKMLLGKKARGECKEGDASYQELKDTSGTIRRQMEGEYWRKMAFSGQEPGAADPRKVRWDAPDGMPTEPQLVELPKYRGFVLRSIMPEDVRRDWSIFRPEEFKRSRRFSYRLKMTEAGIREFFDMPDDKELPQSATTPTTDDSITKSNSSSYNPADRSNLDAQATSGEYTVWCRMDRQANKIYHWIEGTCQWLREPETPEIATTNWFNVWPVLFNRVTGRFLPVSNTTLGRPLQEEINIVRTHKRQAKRAAYDRFLFEQGLLDDDDLKAIRNAPPGSWTPTKKKREDLEKAVYKMPGQFNELVHSVLEERQELGSVLNQSQAAQGMTRGGSDTATEAAIANQTSDAISQEHRTVLESLIREVAVAMGEILVEALPEENAKAIAGPGAYWPIVSREQIWAHLLVEVEAGSMGMPDQQKRLDGLKAAVDIGTAMGLGSVPGGPMWNPIAGMKKISEILDWREDPETLVMLPPPLPPMPGMPGEAPPGAGAPAGAGPEVPAGGVPPAPEMQQEVNAPNLPMVDSAPIPPGMG